MIGHGAEDEPDSISSMTAEEDSVAVEIEEPKKELGAKKGVPNGQPQDAGLSGRHRFFMETGLGGQTLLPGFAWLNVPIVLFMTGFFLFNAVEIFRSYLQSLDEPPVVVGVQFNKQNDLPMTLLCSSITNSTLGNFSGVQFTYFDIGGETNNCDMRLSEVSTGAYSSSYSSDTEDCRDVFPEAQLSRKEILDFVFSGDEETFIVHDCMFLAGLPGFSEVSRTTANLYNVISFYLDLGWNESAPVAGQQPNLFIGAQYFVYDNYENVEATVTVSDGLTFASTFGLLGVDQFTIMGVTKSSMSYFEEELGDERIEYDIYNIELSSAPLFPRKLSEVSGEMVFTDSRVLQTKQTLPTFSVAFGSLGGWLGLLSDGAGFLTVLFTLERCFLIRTRRYNRINWFQPAEEQLIAKSSI